MFLSAFFSPMKLVGGHKFTLKGDDRPPVVKKLAAVPIVDFAEEKRREDERLFGRMGPASSVRRIDPATGKVIAVIPAHDPKPLTKKRAIRPAGRN